MTNTTSRRQRAARAAAGAIATAAIVLGAAACGSETAADQVSDPAAPAAPAAPAVQAQPTPHSSLSADAAERQGAAEHQKQQQLRPPTGHWREIPAT